MTDGQSNGEKARINELERRAEGWDEAIRNMRCEVHADDLKEIKDSIRRVPRPDEWSVMTRKVEDLPRPKEWEDIRMKVLSHDDTIKEIRGAIKTLRVLLVLLPAITWLAAWLGGH